MIRRDRIDLDMHNEGRGFGCLIVADLPMDAGCGELFLREHASQVVSVSLGLHEYKNTVGAYRKRMYISDCVSRKERERERAEREMYQKN